MRSRTDYHRRHRHQLLRSSASGALGVVAATSLSIAAVGWLSVPEAAGDAGRRPSLELAAAALREDRAAQHERSAAAAGARVAARQERARQQRAAKATAERKAAAARAARAAAERARPKWARPLTTYRLSSRFGMRNDPFGRGQRMHNGVDFAAPTGTPIRSIGDGQVEAAGWVGGYGKQVTVRHANATVSTYSHLSEVTVSSGPVRAGDVIGEVGSTGNSTGPHLHLEVRIGDVPVDPQAWLRERGAKI